MGRSRNRNRLLSLGLLFNPARMINGILAQDLARAVRCGPSGVMSAEGAGMRLNLAFASKGQDVIYARVVEDQATNQHARARPRNDYPGSDRFGGRARGRHGAARSWLQLPKRPAHPYNA